VRGGDEIEEHVEHFTLIDAEPAGDEGFEIEVFLVDVEEAGAAGAAIEIFVAAPEGEVDVPVVEMVRDGADGMGAVKADEDAFFVGFFGQQGHIEELAAAKHHRGEKGDGDSIGHVFDDLVVVQGFAVGGGDQDEVVGRV